MNIEFSPLCLGRLGESNLFNELLNVCDSIHLDYMDGEFVPNEAFPIEHINLFDSIKPIHVHLMCERPIDIAIQLKRFSTISAHIETGINFQKFMEYMIINNRDWGVVISPETSIEKLSELDYKPKRIILMAVTPGYSGQDFMKSTLKRIIEIRKLFPNCDLVIDGGMNEETIKSCYSLNASSFVICTDLVRSNDRLAYVQKLKNNI